MEFQSSSVYCYLDLQQNHVFASTQQTSYLHRKDDDINADSIKAGSVNSCDLRWLGVLRLSPTIKLTTGHWNIGESGTKVKWNVRFVDIGV
jgi:hypothetical protein